MTLDMLPVPYYQDELVTIYHADMADILPHLTDVPLYVGSPPYNLGTQPWDGYGRWHPGDVDPNSLTWDRNTRDNGIGYDEHDDKMPWADYETWQRKSLRLMWDSLADDGAIFWNHKPRSIGGRLWKPDSLIEAPLILRQEIVWARAGATSFNAACYAPSSERMYLITKDGWRLDSRGASSVGDVWYIPQERSAHPAPFPLELPARILRTVKPALVVDPYCGSGTTLRAAVDAGIRCIGVDRSERYCRMAAERVAQRCLFPS